METTGLEPATSALQRRCATNCATSPEPGHVIGRRRPRPRAVPNITSRRPDDSGGEAPTKAPPTASSTTAAASSDVESEPVAGKPCTVYRNESAMVSPPGVMTRIEATPATALRGENRLRAVPSSRIPRLAAGS